MLARALARTTTTAAVAPVLAWSRALCSSANAEVLEFLRAASRPIMGKAKAKQSAGQKAVDLTKQVNRLEGLSMDGLLRVDGAELRRRGVPCQERKRLLNFLDKYRQGFRHDMPTHALPAGGINTEQHQATTDGHNDPGRRQAEGRAKGSQAGDARHHQPGTQGRC